MGGVPRWGWVPWVWGAWRNPGAGSSAGLGRRAVFGGWVQARLLGRWLVCVRGRGFGRHSSAGDQRAHGRQRGWSRVHAGAALVVAPVGGGGRRGGGHGRGSLAGLGSLVFGERAGFRARVQVRAWVGGRCSVDGFRWVLLGGGLVCVRGRVLVGVQARGTSEPGCLNGSRIRRSRRTRVVGTAAAGCGGAAAGGFMVFWPFFWLRGSDVLLVGVCAVLLAPGI